MIAESRSSATACRAAARRARLALAAAALAAGAALAAPADGYAEGERAYRRGDVVAAIAALRPAADAGHAPAQVLLAYILDQASFDAEALRYYALAEAQGSADGAFGLAGLYAQGEGTPRDEARARALYAKAAAAGHVAALEALALAYADARLGLVPGVRDDAAARATLERAAERGFAPALRALARAHRSGDYGVAVDPARAAAYEARLPAPPARTAGTRK